MSSRGEVLALLDRLGLKASKRRSQNFLYDDNLIRKIVEFCAISKGEHILEIGPGLGALTDNLLSITDRYTGVELDRGLFDHLIATYPQASFVNRDILSVDPAELCGEESGKITVISNLPYNISSEVVLWLIAHRSLINRAVLLLQREVAERLAALPGTRESGSLSLQVNLYAEASLGPIVSGRSFFPAASVESRVLQIKFRAQPLFSCDGEIFEQVVRAAFGKRRKTILNSLAASNLGLEKVALVQLLTSAGIDPGERAEGVDLERFVKFTNLIKSSRTTELSEEQF